MNANARPSITPTLSYAPASVPAFIPLVIPTVVPDATFAGTLVFWQLCLLVCVLPLGAALFARSLGAGETPAHSRGAFAPDPPPEEFAAPGRPPGRSQPTRPAPTGAAPASATAGAALGATSANAARRLTQRVGGNTDVPLAPEGPPPTREAPAPYLPFTEHSTAQPPPPEFAAGRPHWDRFVYYARQRRVDHARGRELLRSAIRPLAEDGFYAFEDVLTEDDGAMDQLVIGPTGVHPVMIMAHRGYAYYDAATRLLTWGRAKRHPDLPDHESHYWVDLWEEDPEKIMEAFTRSIGREVAHKGVAGIPIFCFTEATVVRDVEGNLPTQLATPFDIAAVLREFDPEAHGFVRPDARHVRELARLAVQNYKRLPWAVPPDDADFAALLDEEL